VAWAGPVCAISAVFNVFAAFFCGIVIESNSRIGPTLLFNRSVLFCSDRSPSYDR
jgi:hypothetical protein